MTLKYKENCSRIKPRHLSDCQLVINLTEVLKNPIKSHYSADYWHGVADVAQCFSRKWHIGPKMKMFGPSHFKFPPCVALYSSVQYTNQYISYYTPWYQPSHNLQKNKVLVKNKFRDDDQWLVCFPIRFKYTHLKVVRWLQKYPLKMTGERKGNMEGGDYDNPQFNYNSLQLKVIIRDNVWFWEISNLQFNITVYTKQAVNSLLFISDSSFF